MAAPDGEGVAEKRRLTLRLHVTQPKDYGGGINDDAPHSHPFDDYEVWQGVAVARAGGMV